MRKSINGLVIILSSHFEQNPKTGDLFIFTNKPHNKIKCLLWHKNGFILIYKKLDKSRFHYSDDLKEGCVDITQAQLDALLMGFDFYVLGENIEEKTKHFH